MCRNGTPLSIAEVVRIGRQIAEGLAAVHDKGLIHRDVKPHNIWLEGPSLRVKLLDFSLARAADDVAITQNGHIVGTVAYMAPEQARGESVDARADLFSLGCVLYLLTTGRLPFDGKDPVSILHALANVTPPPVSELNPETPAPLNRLVAALLARSPEARPPSAAAVIQALATMTEEQGSTTVEPRVEPRGQRPSFYWLGAGLLMLGLGILGMKALPSKDDSGEVPAAARGAAGRYGRPRRCAAALGTAPRSPGPSAAGTRGGPGWTAALPHPARISSFPADCASVPTASSWLPSQTERSTSSRSLQARYSGVSRTRSPAVGTTSGPTASSWPSAGRTKLNCSTSPLGSP